MSLLSICRKVLGETGWPVYPSIATNPDATAFQIFNLANSELEALSEKMDWPHLEVEHAFNMQPTDTIALWPADFRVMAKDAVFDRSAYRSVRGSVGLPFWQLNNEGYLRNISRPVFRAIYPLGADGLQFNVAGQDVIGVYYSKNFVRREDGTTARTYATDTDTSRIPERYVELGVRWRFRRAKGLDYSAELAEYNDTIKTQFSKYNAFGAIPVGGRRINDALTGGFVRDAGFGV